jgi:hypothetical protein
MTDLSLAQCAIETGRDRSTILRAIRKGRLSASRDSAGAYRVQPVELFRVFDARRAEALPEAAPQHSQANAQLELRIAELKATLADALEQRDRWQAVAERLTLSPPAPRRAWWRKAG